MNQLVTTDWLDKNIEKVKILDASWHLPNTNRNSFEEYKAEHIFNSIFFDIDKNSNQKTNLPHMLPSKEDWEMIVSSLGISNSDHIIVYDNSDVFSSCRVWYSFLYFGHDPKLISVLDGGFKKWTNEKRPTTKEIVNFDRSKYIAVENTSLVINKDEVKKVAHLARLELNEDEINNHAEQLEKILEYIKQLEKIDTDDVPCTTRAIEVTNIMRKDENKNSDCTEDLLELGPSIEDKYFKVPKIISE